MYFCKNARVKQKYKIRKETTMKKVKLLSLFLSLVLVFASFSGFDVYAVGDTLETAQPVEATRVREI